MQNKDRIPINHRNLIISCFAMSDQPSNGHQI
jgi:hypothetical protein